MKQSEVTFAAKTRERLVPPPLFRRKLDGVIAHLTRECGGNAHKKRIVNVTVSSVYDNDSSNQLKNVVDLGTGRYGETN